MKGGVSYITHSFDGITSLFVMSYFSLPMSHEGWLHGCGTVYYEYYIEGCGRGGKRGKGQLTIDN